MKKIPTGPSSADALARRLHGLGVKIVFTNGCFDILHVGHTRLLEAAKSYGDVLVVGINSDASVKRLKGDSRPVVSENDRAEVLLALRAVDHVVIFEEDTPVDLIRLLRPHIHVKGGDYRPDALPESPVVRACGGEVRIFGFVDGKSSTNIIARASSCKE